MRLLRLRVNGGFLNGIDVKFGPGLNVIVGPRGSGKTTLLELIRYGVGAKKASAIGQTQGKREKEYVKHLLGDGELIIDIETSAGNQQLITDSEGRGRLQSYSDTVLYLGQSEIEEIAENSVLRRELIDLRGKTPGTTINEETLIKFTDDIHNLRKEVSEQESHLRALGTLQADRESLQQKENSLIEHGQAEVAGKREKLREYEREYSSADRAAEYTSAAIDESRKFKSKLRESRNVLESLITAIDRVDGVSDIRQTANQMSDNIEIIDKELESVEEKLQRKNDEERNKSANSRKHAAPLRDELEEAERGLGELTSKLQKIEKQITDLNSLKIKKEENQSTVDNIKSKRASVLDQLEEQMEEEYSARREAARESIDASTPNISIVVDHLADDSIYRQWLTSSLKGSRLKASTFDAITEYLMPRELLELVEDNNVEKIVENTGISESAAEKLVDYLDTSEVLAKLAVTRLEDLVDFFLLDGTVKKSVESLSTGQKCAVTLPILLSERGRTLILDQPEDHLDNGYLVDNIVWSILRRTEDEVQTIVATHNPNIPVLGSAGDVFVMESNGNNGGVKLAGSYDERNVVTEITSVMEGGRDAFQRRAEFYESHSGLK